MHGRIRKLSLIVCLSLLLQILLSTPLRAQQTEDNDNPKFVEISPASGTVVAATQVTITGRVEDASPIEIEMDEVTVQADSEGRFTLKNVPLKQGENTITLFARDKAGNSERLELELIGKDLTPPAAPVVFAVKPSTRLPLQLIEGRAEPEAQIIITGGDKPIVVDAAYWTGLFGALVPLREGSNELTLTALDDAGVSPSVRVSIERTSEQPLHDGEPAQINFSSGNAQYGLPGTPFPRPIVVLVTDRRGHPVGDVPVEFTVRHGDVQFGSGQRFAARTDVSGRASAQVTSGKTLGIQLVRADFRGNTSTPASFDVETTSLRPDGLTSVSGIVVDWYNQPLSNVPVRLDGKTMRTGRDGRFIFERARPGQRQRLEVVGDDITAGEHSWSDASYIIDVLPGVYNQLGRPMFVSALNDGATLALDAEGRITKGTVIAWQDDERDAAPEVTLRDGVRVTTVPPARLDSLKFSATIFGDHRVPVSLDDGLATGLYVFVRPRDVEFETPLPIKLPNLDTLAPRSPVLIMRYHPQTGRWAEEGGASVSSDGKTVDSDAGSGIRGGGWYAFPGRQTYAEYTNVNFLQIKGDPELEGKDVQLEITSGGKSAMMMSWWGEGGFKRVHYRITHPALGDDIILPARGSAHTDSGREVEVTVTPSGHAIKPGETIMLSAVGRPHPGGYYLWTSSDPSVASVEPFLNDFGAEHPNRARVVGHRLGSVKISAIYITSTGVTSVAFAHVFCRTPKAR
jgi:hypothetical protein